MAGLGILRYGYIDLKKIGDCVPVDLVSSAIIVATAYNMTKANIPILQVGTSDLSPISWAVLKKEV